MSDDRKNQGRRDRDRIDVNEEHDLRNWAHSLGVGLDELKEAVKAVGDRVDAVKQHLARGKERGIEGKRDGRF